MPRRRARAGANGGVLIAAPASPPRYRFGTYLVSPRRRVVTCDGRELPLIPRYFDLLVFLIEHRHEAVHRRDIFERVWSDVIVSESALSQAVRTLRRTFGDDPREPRFIRTVSRHGYQFVFPGVVEEPDDNAVPQSAADPPPTRSSAPDADAFEPLLERLTRLPREAADEEDRREAAEMLHALGTGAALERLGTRPGHAHARALLRDTRWDTPDAQPVPVLGAPAPVAVARALVALRLRRAARIAALRWAGGSAGGGLAGIAAGAIGGVILAGAPDGQAPLAVTPVLAVVGGACGALGGAGVAAGLSMAEAIARSVRAVALIAGGAAGGTAVGCAVQLIGGWALAALVGLELELGGSVEGLALGAAAGLGYAAATTGAADGLAAPRGGKRLRAAAVTAAFCGMAALGLAVSGRPLVGGTLHAIARAAQGAQVTLTPLGRLIGEPDFGPVSQAILGAGEGTVFGFGLALGLMRRPAV